jgi:hypothetical protein
MYNTYVYSTGTALKTKEWRCFKAIWNGFSVHGIPEQWTEKYILLVFEPEPARSLW